MTTMKSLERRLSKIPEPDLERAQSDLRYQWLKQFSSDQRRALREVCRVAHKEDRALTREEMAGALGISIAEFEASVRAAISATLPGSASGDGEMPANTGPAAELEATETPIKPETKKARQPSDGTSAARKGVVSAKPPPRSRKSQQPKPPPKPASDVHVDESPQAKMPRVSSTAPKLEPMHSEFSFEQRLALRHLVLEAEKAGRTTVTWREICAATGISMVELSVRRAKVRHPEIAPDPKIPDTSLATRLEAKGLPTKPKQEKTNNASQPKDGVSAAPKKAASAKPPPRSKKPSQPKPAPKPSHGS